MKEKLFIIFSLAFITLTAQDIHFSQFSAIKASLNPALIGYQQQDYQIQLQRRSQWESVTKPFTTFSVAINRKITSSELDFQDIYFYKFQVKVILNLLFFRFTMVVSHAHHR